MHLVSILKVVGTLLVVLGISQLVPMSASLYYGDGDWAAFFSSGLGAALLGGGLFLASRHARDISERDGFAAVTISWLVAALAGAVPYLLTGDMHSLADAMFESMAGFTTTGASVLSDYTALGQGILLWRSMTQWFGGMGIIVLALVILPALGIGGMQLYKREVPGPYSEKLTPRLRDTAKALWSVYVGITAAETGVLVALGMSPFEALNHALTTVSTGGFSTRPDSVAGFGSPAIEWAVIAFMFIAGMNFALHFRLLTRLRGYRAYLTDSEWRWYSGAVLLATAAVTLHLMLAQGYEPFRALTKGTFQVVSILTTTGYVTDDYMKWGAFAQGLLLLLMIAGGSAGSTAGGIKWVRLLLVLQYVRMEMLRLIHPKVVMQAKLNRRRVGPDILANIFALVFLFLTALAVCTLLVSLDGHSLLTSLGAAASALGNVGPGLGSVGPVETYAHLSAYAKWVLVVAMLMGRLELMTVFVLFLPHAWQR